ncbi:MAG: hypothetical protein J5518_05785 [Lachnospiraceae bacterium]|nr:hypothetical protein [Lachnospiraceae bacterium]
MMKRIEKNIKRILTCCLYTTLLTVLLLAVIRCRVDANDPVTITAPARFFGSDQCLTVTVEGNADGHSLGLIAEAFSDGKTVDRKFKTINGSGDVKFDTFGRGDLFEFRIIAVDKTTLAPVCNTLSLVRKAGAEEVEQQESDTAIAAMPEGTSIVLKAVTKDLILAKRTLEELEALDSETVSVEITEDVITEETDENGVTVNNVTQETRTAELIKYDAISVNDDAYAEAVSRLEATKTAYEKLRTSAAVLFTVAGENEQLKSYALQAGDIAKAAEDAAVSIEAGYTLKRADQSLVDTDFLAEIDKVREAHKIIRIGGGANLLLNGGFCTYPKGADLALVSDQDSSVVILEPDNGKVTQGSARRAGFAEDMSKIIVTSGNNAAELAVLAVGEEPVFRKYDGFTAAEGGLATHITTLVYATAATYSESSVSMLTAYAKELFTVAAVGTHTTYEEIEEAFLASADNSAATLGAYAGSGGLAAADEAFADDLTEAYNDRRGLTEYWSCGDPAYLKSDYRGIHCTCDQEGNIVGLYESFTYGVKCEELYFTSPVPDNKKGLGPDKIPDSRKGCVYEKIWRNIDYPDPDVFCNHIVNQPGYDPANIRTRLYEVYEYGKSTSQFLGSPGGDYGYDDAADYLGEAPETDNSDADERLTGVYAINEYDDPEGEPSVQVCHFKRYYENNENGQVEIESVAVYNPALWEYYKSQGENWDRARSKCYDILRQKNYTRDGKLALDISYVGSVPGYERNDMVYVKKYDTSDGSPMLAAEYYEPATWMSGIGLLMGYAYFTFNPTYRSEHRAYYTPEFFDSNDRTRRVPENKRRLFYGKVRYYRSKDGSITGYNHLVSWADPEEADNGRIFFNGADTTSFPTDKFMLEEYDQKNVGVLRWVIRDDNYEISMDKYELVFRTDQN